MIAVDWGTSNLRAFRLHGGAIVDQVGAGPGLLAVPPGGFPAALRTAIAPWLDAGERRVLMAGMVGSRQGWVEAPYLPCPAEPATLAAAAMRVPFEHADVRLVPGLVATDPTGVPEVMRGEEVQLVGILDRTGPDALVCLPGSHSKWATLRAGRIAGFTTHLTGEAYAALRGHTILGRLMQDGPTHRPTFLEGAARARQPGGLLHHLFGVRTLGLFDRLPGPHAASYLSGLLIGHEIAAIAPNAVVDLVGDPTLCALYAAAVEQAGCTSRSHDGTAAATGLWRLSEHVAWT